MLIVGKRQSNSLEISKSTRERDQENDPYLSRASRPSLRDALRAGGTLLGELTNSKRR